MLAPSVPVAAIGIAVAASGFGVSLSLYRSILAGFAPETLRGGLISLGESLGRVGATSAPILMSSFIGILEPTYGFAAALR